MDDLVERFWKSLAIIFGGFVFIYALIVISSERPRGVNLIIYDSMNQLFKWLFIFIVVVAIGCILIFVIQRYFEGKAEEGRKLQEEEKRKHAKHLAWVERVEKLEHERLREEKQVRMKEQTKMEEQQRLIEEEQYLKNRSAKDANNDALKNFL